MHGWVRGQRGGGSGGPAGMDPAPQARVPSRCPCSRRAGTDPGPCSISPSVRGTGGSPRLSPCPPVRRVPWAGSAPRPSPAGGGSCAPDAAGSCRSAGRRCGGCGASGASPGWVPRSPLPRDLHAPVPPSNAACGRSQGRGRDAAGVQSLHCCCRGLLVLGCWRTGEGVTTSRGCGSGTFVPGPGSWLEGLCGCAHHEPWGRGDSAPGSARRRAAASRPVPQVLLMCYKSCWDGAFQVTEEVGTTPPGGNSAALASPRVTEPGGTRGAPQTGLVPSGLSCPRTCESPVSVLASSSAQPWSLD